MNPVLLKPQSDVGSQVVVQGKVIGQMKASDYAKNKGTLLEAVMQSYHRLGEDADICRGRRGGQCIRGQSSFR